MGGVLGGGGQAGGPHYAGSITRVYLSNVDRDNWGCVTSRAFSRSGPQHVWQKRFYDFNVWTEHKPIEKLRYMHRNPVKRGLVASPQLWHWSSFRAYFLGAPGPVRC